MRDLHDDLLARQHDDSTPVDDSDESTESFNWEDPWHRSNQGEYLHENDPWNDAGRALLQRSSTSGPGPSSSSRQRIRGPSVLGSRQDGPVL